MSTTYYQGARIFDRENLLDGFALAVDNGRTTAILPQADIPEHSKTISLNGGILTPGFIETQANGGGGVLVNHDSSEAGLAKILAGHRQYGTVAILPTFITDSQEKYHQAIANIAAAVERGQHGIIGGHFEGPFLSLQKKGTHNPAYLRKPDASDFAIYAKYAEHLQHSILSLAPEEQERGAIAAIKPYIPQINLAHSMANHADIARAYAEGLTGITHLYNAMPPMSGRGPGPIGAAAEYGLYAGIIPDGIHSEPISLAHAYQALGSARLMLATDSMHTIGAPNIREFDLMGITVYVQNDRLVNEYGALAGANINQLQCLHNAIRYMHADLKNALRMLITTPADYIRRPDLTHIANRRTADILYLDDSLNLQNWQI